MTTPARRRGVTRLEAVADADTRRHLDDWAKVVPDPHERLAWIDAFGLTRHFRAPAYIRHFTDPIAARAWDDHSMLHARHAAYLHSHGIDPNDPATRERLNALDIECTNEAIAAHGLDGGHRLTTVINNPGLDVEGEKRACITLGQPHLERADRDVIIAARLTLTELDTAIADGTYDRDAIAVLSAMTEEP